MKIRKRDGRIKDYDFTRIQNAILKATNDVEEYKDTTVDLQSIFDDVENKIKNYKKDIIDIETIQDIILKVLYKHNRKIYKSFKTYRDKRAEARENTIDKEIDSLIAGENEYWQKENSNKNATLVTTQRDYLAGIVSKDATRRKLLPKDVVELDKKGIIHFHDADYFLQNALHNCELINLEDMLQNGTVINGYMIEKPHRFLTAMTIATQIITQVTSCSYGGCTITLTHLAPFLRDSKKYYIKKYKNRGLSDEQVEKFATEDLQKELEDGVQTFNYQINSMSNTNGQSPFLSVFCYLSEDKEYTKEVAMITEEFFKQRLQGMKNENGINSTQAFPKILYVLEERNIRKGSEYFWLTELGAKCTARRFVPDYISEKKMKEYKDGYCFPCMGCRSFLSPWKDENGNVKFYGRFNKGVVTINLPYVGLEANKDINKFWELLDKYLEVCHKALICRYEKLKGTKSDVAPILWQYGALARLKKGETIDKLLTGGYSSISLGYVGLYETCLSLIGESHTTENGQKLATKILKHLNDKLNEWEKQLPLGYGLYGCPQETTTETFAKALQRDFGIIKGITDRDFVTNSYHVYVGEPIDAFTKLTLEGKFQALSTGGAVSYVEADNLENNIEVILQVIEHIYENIMYAEINIKSDSCAVCGYTGEMKTDKNYEWYCPNCGNRDHDTLDVTRRTCGYIGKNWWNKGRTEDIANRYVHLTDHVLEEDDL